LLCPIPRQQPVTLWQAYSVAERPYKSFNGLVGQPQLSALNECRFEGDGINHRRPDLPSVLRLNEG
jgi:hypothetical protein